MLVLFLRSQHLETILLRRVKGDRKRHPNMIQFVSYFQKCEKKWKNRKQAQFEARISEKKNFRAQRKLPSFSTALSKYFETIMCLTKSCPMCFLAEFFPQKMPNKLPGEKQTLLC